ncbi:phosphotransferase [Actinacidiphila oryziradicis]|uniref:maltokinase N-terminal cap-like domain-containing protein n=1 Tax=Actinacidiphila oryziradicis TaxID=2571141 RepID=UPI0023F1B172|nr:phosphotransferase [Actinacidiphila oryziradicis]MCW2870893.1 pep2 protein [Actinacidiphila oryziradicis]
MSETSWLRSSTTTSTAPPAPGLLHGLAPLLREWLPRQRWFAGKGSPISGFGLVSATELLPCDTRIGTPGLLHVLLEVHQADAEPDCYQLLLGTRTMLPPALAPALIGHAVGGPLDGLTVYQALHDPRLAGHLLDRLRSPGRTESLRFTAESGAGIPSGLAPRLSTAEQSNTSVIYGDTYILKLFRRISPGPNPDLELSLALARAGSQRIAAPAAWFEAVGIYHEPATLGVLQHYLPASADGWALALQAVDEGNDFTSEARALGQATAEVHAALARALPTAVLRRQQIEHLAASMAERLDAAATAVPALRPYRTQLRTAFHDLAVLGGRGRSVAAQRVHGDLHLGQALRTPAQGWVLIDFEGEPARPLPERRRPAPPVQDVAGMLRSFDYAARHRDPVAPGAAAWAERHRAAFCVGYADASGTDPRSDPVLIRAYETDKAVYEVLYEARNRPAWLPIPMSAVQRLAAGPDPLAPPRRSSS